VAHELRAITDEGVIMGARFSWSSAVAVLVGVVVVGGAASNASAETYEERGRAYADKLIDDGKVTQKSDCVLYCLGDGCRAVAGNVIYPCADACTTKCEAHFDE
jgi:hypothetical protein